MATAIMRRQKGSGVCVGPIVLGSRSWGLGLLHPVAAAADGLPTALMAVPPQSATPTSWRWRWRS